MKEIERLAIPDGYEFDCVEWDEVLNELAEYAEETGKDRKEVQK